MTNRAATGRRLSREARRQQLVDAALVLAAEQGFAGLTLEEVADRAGVTRNLLYHYFPGGHRDLVIAVAEEAGARLSGGWTTDESLPREERLARNFAGIAAHAFTPTPEWQVYRQSRAYGDREAQERSRGYRETVVAAIARNNTGSPDPSPLVRMAIEGFLAYAEAAMEHAREARLDRERVLAVLAETLVATVAAAQAAEQVAEVRTRRTVRPPASR